MPLNGCYIFLFGSQMCLLYFRFLSILSRSRLMGPFIRMIFAMLSDLLNFSAIVVLMLIGFAFAIAFAIGSDTKNTEECFANNTEYTRDFSAFSSISLYMFQVLLGQHDWEQIVTNNCFGQTRANVAQLFIIIFSVLGTVLLLNLLIALMASTYENKRQSTSRDTRLVQAMETYRLVQRPALIS
eukprot:221164_1